MRALYSIVCGGLRVLPYDDIAGRGSPAFCCGYRIRVHTGPVGSRYTCPRLRATRLVAGHGVAGSARVRG
jgi:hypothetical protein